MGKHRNVTEYMYICFLRKPCLTMFDSQMVVLSLGHAIVIFVVVSNVFSLLTFDKTKVFARDPCEYKELVPGDELPAGPLLVDVFF